MKTFALGALLAAALTLPSTAQPLADSNREIARQVYDDVKVVRRVAEVGRRDLPRDILQTILAEDLETLRGKTSEFQYRYAAYERIEANRREQRFTFDTKTEESDLESFSMKGDLTYRVRVQIPGRRMLLLRNPRVWVDRVDVTYVPIGGSAALADTVEIKAWLDPGDERVVDVPRIARSATATVWVRTEVGKKASIDLALYEPSLVDDPNSPFATAVRRFQSLGDAVRDRDYRKVRNVADEVLALLESQAGATQIRPIPPTILPTDVTARAAGDDLYFELRHIEDLLRGSESDRAEGLERLRRLITRVRPD